MDDDLKAYLDQQFRQMREETDRQFREAREVMDRQFRESREETDRQFREMGGRMERLETDIRGAHVLIEDVQDKVRLVAEGVDNLKEQMERMDEKLSRKIEDVKTFSCQAYQDLDTRVRKLEATH